MRITNCFDSHVHLSSIGHYEHLIDLSKMRSSSDIFECVREHTFTKGEWILGAGWDNNSWSDTAFPTKEILDKIFPYNPVSFNRVDEHAMWVNSKALEISMLNEFPPEKKIEGGEILYSSELKPTGILIDNAMNFVMEKIPEIDLETCTSEMVEASNILNRAGFTHVRDMGHSEVDFNALVALETNNNFSLAVEKYFSVYDGAGFEKVLCEFLKCKNEKLKKTRLKGIKIFLDGALGSEGALLSQNYIGSEKRGIRFHQNERLKEMMIKTWEHKIDIAVHAIGDEAVSTLVDTALELKEKNGVKGKLCIEHVELASLDTILKMKELDVTCYMQPCHFLTDGAWLEKKLGGLSKLAFPWEKIEKHGIPLYFGSDAPIERASLKDNMLALQKSTEFGINKISKPIYCYQSHPDINWIRDCYTDIDGSGVVKSVYFEGNQI